MVEDPALSRTEPCLKKMPEPIMVPITIESAEPNPSERFSSVCGCFSI